MDLLNPRIDLAFKKIFGSEENKDLLISFINSIVSKEDQVVDVQILNPYNSRNFAKDKLSILDIKAKDTLGTYYNIEVQICDEGDYDKRALYYWSKLYADQIGQRDEYEKLRKAIAIHVLNFHSIPEAPKYFNRFIIMNEETQKRHFEDLEIYTIELSKFSEKGDEPLALMLPRIKTGLDRWAAFLTRASSLNANNLPQELSDPYIQKAMDTLTRVSLSEDERALYEWNLKWWRTETSALAKAEKKGMERGIEKGIEKGRVEGALEEKRKIALEMLIDNEPEAKIIKYSGLTADQIAEIRKAFIQ